MSDRRCNATVDGKNRCEFAGTQDELVEHATECGHPLCAVCAWSLRDDETGCCLRCVARTRTALLTIRDTFTELEATIEATALHPGDLPGGIALVLLADGNDAAPRPYKPEPYTEHPAVEYPEITGTTETVPWYKYDHQTDSWESREATLSTTHSAYVDTRPVPDGTEHYADHWPTDPTPPLVAIDTAVRGWRIMFGHPIPDSLPTVDADIDYLLLHLSQASRTDDDFPDFAAEVRDLASKLEHVTGQANDPVYAPADCFDCGGQLVSEYREPRQRDHRRRLQAIAEQRRAEMSYGITALTPLDLASLGDPAEGREMVGDADGGGNEPVWSCRACGGIYEPASYYLAIRAALEAKAMAS